jgi:6-phosphogluconolactonase
MSEAKSSPAAMSDVDVLISDDPASEFGSALGSRGLAGETIVLTGGSTVGRAYEQAAQTRDWSGSTLFFGDERSVPLDDPRSNYGLARRTLLDRLEAQPAVHRIRGELDPAEAAAAYERELEDVVLDLLLLGLGPDGHVASLFPGSPQLAERTRLVTSGPAGLEPWVDRVTLTLPALLSARETWLLVTGAQKAETVARALRGPITDEVPASLLRRGEGRIVAFLDHPAASRLPARAAS